MPPPTITTPQRRSTLAMLVEPSAAVVARSDRRTARLLSTVLALLGPMALLSMTLQLIAAPGHPGSTIALSFAVTAILGAYALSRTRHFRLAGAITTFIPTVAGLAVLFAVNDDPGWFAFMGLNPALGALFLPLRGAVLLAVANLVGVVVGVLAVPSLDADTAIVAIMFNAIISIVLLTAAAFRNLLEQDRRADLQARQRLQQTILDGTFGGMAVVRDGVVTDANTSFAGLFGRQPGDLVDRRLDDVDDTEVASVFLDVMRRTGTDPIDAVVPRHDGVTSDVEIVVRRIDDDQGTTVLAVRDISARKQAERTFRRAQQMETVGRLAAGLAHDTGNELLVISALTSELRRQHVESGLRVDEIEQIEAAADRVAGLIRRVLVVGRDDRTEPDLIDVGDFLAQGVSMWQQVLGDAIDLRIDGSEVGHVRMARSGFEQLFLNLVLNARDALSHGGSVTIEASMPMIDGDHAPAGLTPGRYQRLTIADDGAGIAGEHLERVFDPFFTTKEDGRGTGLGLFTSREVVRQAGGEMAVSSNGDGSVFTVHLPAYDAAGAG